MIFSDHKGIVIERLREKQRVFRGYMSTRETSNVVVALFDAGAKQLALRGHA